MTYNDYYLSSVQTQVNSATPALSLSLKLDANAVQYGCDTFHLLLQHQQLLSSAGSSSRRAMIAPVNGFQLNSASRLEMFESDSKEDTPQRCVLDCLRLDSLLKSI